MVKKIAESTVSTMVDGVAAIGPYSCGKIISTPAGTWGHSAGQIGKHPKTGKLAGTLA